MSTEQEYTPELATVDLKKVVNVNKADYVRFLAQTKHAPTMVRNSMMLSYERAIENVTKALDLAKVKPE